MQYHRSKNWSDYSGAGTSSVSSTQYYHVVYVIDPSSDTITLYVDGVAEITTAYDDSEQYHNPLGGNYTRNWEVGSISRANLNHNFAGFMDDLIMWDTALTSSEVATLYNGGTFGVLPTTVQTNNVRAYYDFDNATSSSVPDESGNGYNSTSTSNIEIQTANTNVPYTTY
jgi:hypothetical protein